MPIFKYKAINKNGESYDVSMEAPDRFAIYKKVKEDGDKILNVTEVRSKTAATFARINSSMSKVKQHEKIIFARNLAAMIEAGLSVTRAIAVMEKQTKGKKLKVVLADLNDDVSRGLSLSDSMKRKPDTFSTLFVSMVKAGEESGNLAGSLKVVASQMEKIYQLTKRVRGALMYPAVILCLMVVITVLMMVYMVPTLTSTFEGLGVDLPLSTRIIINISNFIRENPLLLIGIVTALITGLIAFARSKRGKVFFNYLVLKIPFINTMVKEINSARTARTLASLLSSGVDVLIALDVTADVMQNVYYKQVLERAKKSVEKGEPISNVFIQNERLYPVFVGEMISVGEETGKMADMLSGVATFYEEEVDQKTKDLSAIIEPLLMIFIGLGVGIFAISMLAPTYSLVENI